MSIDFSSRLQRAVRELGLALDSTQEQQLLNYLEQLQRWNRVYNLTAIRESEQILIQHIFDSLSVVPFVSKMLYKKTVDDVMIADVGSGAGLPGIVLAIVGGWNVCCVDAVEKKVAFIRQMAGVLGLDKLTSHHARIEKLPSLNADIVISRAFSSLLDFAHLAGGHVAADGSLLAMKGRAPRDEISELEAQSPWRVRELVALSVPELDAQRCVLRLSLREAYESE